jgi:hypothetical protein
MSNKRLLQREGAVESRSVSARAEVGSARGAGSDVNAYRNVEILSDDQIGIEEGIAGPDSDVLVRHLAEYGEAPLLVQAAE